MPLKCHTYTRAHQVITHKTCFFLGKNMFLPRQDVADIVGAYLLIIPPDLPDQKEICPGPGKELWLVQVSCSEHLKKKTKLIFLEQS